jgi:hypothetical protein
MVIERRIVLRVEPVDLRRIDAQARQFVASLEQGEVTGIQQRHRALRTAHAKRPPPPERGAAFPWARAIFRARRLGLRTWRCRR